MLIFQSDLLLHHVVLLTDISNGSFVQFQIWDFPGQCDFVDPTFDTESIFGVFGALIFVIDAQVINRRIIFLFVDYKCINTPPRAFTFERLCCPVVLWRYRN